MESIGAKELAAWLADPTREKPVVLDVREDWELAICRIEGSVAIPMNSIPGRFGELDPAAAVVCVCHHGVRSMHVASFLAGKGFTRTYNLSGGIEDWARQVDRTMARY